MKPRRPSFPPARRLWLPCCLWAATAWSHGTAGESNAARFKSNPWAYAKERAAEKKAEREAIRAAQAGALAAFLESEWIANNPTEAAEQTRARLARAEAQNAELAKALAELKAAFETFAKESAEREAALAKKLEAEAARAEETAKNLEAKDKAQSAALAEARRLIEEAQEKARESSSRRFRQIDALRARTMRDLEVQSFSNIELVRIPAGEFMMGSTPEDVAQLRSAGVWNPLDAVETPAHAVRITRPFLIGRFEVTQEVWRRIMGKTEHAFKGDTLPADSVSWHEAQAFCTKLSKETGGVWRLPTEAEWEYACRAGGGGLFGTPATLDKLDDFAWTARNSEARTHEPGGKAANGWGLHDMHGNVWEWCADGFDPKFHAVSPAENPLAPATGTERVFRGGAYGIEPGQTRAAFRGANLPDFKSPMVGLRVVREIE